MFKMTLSLIVLAGLAGVIAPVAATEPEMKFELYQDKANEYRWRLKSSDGAVLAVAAVGHKQHADAKDGLERFKKLGTAGDLKFDTFVDESKSYRWRLVSDKGDTVAVSEGGYKAAADADRAIASLKAGAGKAGVVVLK